jgi:hypothetical protein
MILCRLSLQTVGLKFKFSFGKLGLIAESVEGLRLAVEPVAGSLGTDLHLFGTTVALS